MRNRTPWLLFALSLVLNVFVVAGAVYSSNLKGAGEATPDDRLQTVVERLGLSAVQRDQLIAVRERTIVRREEMRAAGGRIREVLIAALEAPDYDRTALETRMRQRNVHRVEFFAETGADLHGFLAGLDPDQKAAFLELIQQRRFLRQLLGRSKANRT